MSDRLSLALTFALPVTAAFTFAAPAGAAPLAPGGVIFPTGTTVAAEPDLAGTVINDNVLPFSIDPTPATPFTSVGGNVQNRVVRSDNTGTMIFGPRIRDTFNIDGGTFLIEAFRLVGYNGFATDVDFRTDGTGDVGFTSVSRSVDGDTMTFRYGTPLQIDAIAPGVQEESLFPSILTDGPSFTTTGRMTIFGTLRDDPDTLYSVSIGNVAVPAIPLPATLWLGLAGLGALGLAGRRRA